MSKSSDGARKQQLLGSMASSESPMGKFMWGKYSPYTLKDY